MNFHQIGRPSPNVNFLLCPHGISNERSCLQCGRLAPQTSALPRATDFFGDDRMVFEFVQEHGVEAVMCSACGGYTYDRIITEHWHKSESVDFSDLDEEDPQHHGSVSSAEYHDYTQEEQWACASCMHVASPELSNLMNQINKEPS